MKKLLFAGLAAALSLVGCNKEADVKGLDAMPFEVVLNFEETRTVTEDGIHTKWAEGDKINVIHAEAGTTEYKHDTPDNKAYVVSDTETGVFKGTLQEGALEAGKSYDWYLFYPYSKYITSPVNTSENGGYVYVGGRSDQSQTQNGYNSRLHLAGGDKYGCFPLYGVVKNVPAATQPVVTMKHVASAIAINVKNATSDPITISEVAFTAPEAIIGQFYVSFDKEPLTFDAQTYSAATASVRVENPTALAAGETAILYMGIKPFTAKSGDKLSIKITADKGIVEKEITLPSNVQFKPGLVKTINVEYEAAHEAETSSLAEILEMATNSDVVTEEVLVVAKYARGIMLGQNGTFLLAFNNAGVNAAVGDIVTVSGKVGEYAGFKQIAEPSVRVISSGNEVVLPEPRVLANIDEYGSEKVELIQYTGTLKVSGNFYNVEVPGCTKKGSIQYPLNTDALNALKDKTIIATGFFTGITGSNTYVNMMSTSVEAAAVNAFNVTPEGEVNVAATATSLEIQVTGNVDWTAEASEGASIDKVSGNGDAVITVSFPANTDTEHVKNYSVAVRTEATGVRDEFIVEITQAKADVAGVHTATIDFSEQGYENAQEVASATAGIVTFTFDKGTNGNAPKYYTTGTAIRMYGSNSMTVSADGKTIISIELGFGSGDGTTNPITTNVPAYEEPVWTGEAGSVTFTIGGTTGQRRIKTVTVKYNDTDAPVVTATLESISVTGQKTEFNVGDEFTHDTAKVTATYSDGSTKDVTASATFSKPDMTTAGTKEVTVSYTEGEVTRTTSYEITVSAGGSASTVAAVLAGGPGTYSVEGMLVYAVSGSNVIVGDATGKMLLYKSSHGLEVGDIVDASNVTVTEYKGVLEMTSGTYTKKSSGNPVDHGSPTSLDDATAASAVFGTFSAEGFHSAQFVSITGTQSGRYIQNDNAKLYMNVANATNDGYKVVSTGYVYSYSTGYSNYNYQVVTIEKSADDQYCLVSPEALSVAATATEATFTIQANAAWTVTSDNSAFTVSPASGNADATVTVSFSANGTSAARVANLTVSCPDASVTKTVVLTQAAPAPQGDGYTIVFGNKAKSATAISATTKASTVISTGTDYVTTQPFTVDLGTVYYGDSQDCIRLGKTGAASQLTIALSDAGKISASSIVVNCKKMQGNKNTGAQLTVNGVGPQSPAANEASASDLTFTLSSTGNLETIVLEGTAGIFIYSITVNK